MVINKNNFWNKDTPVYSDANHKPFNSDRKSLEQSESTTEELESTFTTGKFLNHIPSSDRNMVRDINTLSIDQFISHIKSKYHVANNEINKILMIYTDSAYPNSKFRKYVSLADLLNYYRGPIYLPLYPNSFHTKLRTELINEIESYRNEIRTNSGQQTTISPAFPQVSDGKHLSSYPGVHPGEFIISVLRENNIALNPLGIYVSVKFKDETNMTPIKLEKMLSISPELIQYISYPNAFTGSVRDLFEQYRNSSPSEQQRLWLSVISDGVDFNNALSKTNNNIIDAGFQGLDIITNIKNTLNSEISKAYEKGGVNGRLNSESQVPVKIKIFDPYSGGLQQVAIKHFSLLEIATGQLQAYYGTNYSFEVDVDSSLKSLFQLPSRIYSMSFPVTERIFANVKNELAYVSAESFNAQVTVQRNLMKYRVADYINAKDPLVAKTSYDLIEERILGDFIENKSEYYDLKGVKLYGEKTGDLFSIRIPDGRIIFSTMRQGYVRITDKELNENDILWLRKSISLQSLSENSFDKFKKEKCPVTRAGACYFKPKSINDYIEYVDVKNSMTELSKTLVNEQRERAFSDLNTLFYTSSEGWRDFALSFGKDFLSGISTIMGLIPTGGGSLLSKLSIKLSGLLAEAGNMGAAYMISQLSNNKKDDIYNDLIFSTILSLPDMISTTKILTKLRRLKSVRKRIDEVADYRAPVKKRKTPPRLIPSTLSKSNPVSEKKNFPLKDSENNIVHKATRGIIYNSQDETWNYASNILYKSGFMNSNEKLLFNNLIKSVSNGRTSTSTLLTKSRKIDSMNSLLETEEGDVLFFFNPKDNSLKHVMVSLDNGKFAGIKNKYLDDTLSQKPRILTAEELGAFNNSSFRSPKGDEYNVYIRNIRKNTPTTAPKQHENRIKALLGSRDGDVYEIYPGTGRYVVTVHGAPGNINGMPGVEAAHAIRGAMVSKGYNLSRVLTLDLLSCYGSSTFINIPQFRKYSSGQVIANELNIDVIAYPSRVGDNRHMSSDSTVGHKFTPASKEVQKMNSIAGNNILFNLSEKLINIRRRLQNSIAPDPDQPVSNRISRSIQSDLLTTKLEDIAMQQSMILSDEDWLSNCLNVIALDDKLLIMSGLKKVNNGLAEWI